MKRVTAITTTIFQKTIIGSPLYSKCTYNINTQITINTKINSTNLLNYQHHHDITIEEQIIELSKDEAFDCVINPLQN